jgi:spermidine synthase
MKASRPTMTSGVVGLGAGSVATYLRPGDRMRFFEIDPAVARIASDPRYFTYLSDCTQGEADIILGDARLTLLRETPGSLDVLLLDAFTSDAIPTHLLTVEAIEQYLRILKPDGVLLVHISNRHLALEGVVAAAAKAAGAEAHIQWFRPAVADKYAVSASDVMVISRSQAALAPFAASGRWPLAHAGGTRAWTDDYTNVIGALIEQGRRPRDP